MDRRVVLSVAGSGKTSYLIDRLDKERRFLVVTYTNNNTEHLKQCIIRKFGFIPRNISVFTYFEFLMAVCYKPFLADKYQAKGIDWRMPEIFTLKFKRTNKAFFFNKQGYLYHNRIALLCQPHVDKIATRIKKYYDCFYYDEAQDLDGHDFDLFRNIVKQCDVEALIVGDFFQHTFSTSKDGKVNSTLYNNFGTFIKLWEETGLVIDTHTLSKSYRCSPTIAEFVRNHVGIEIYSHQTEESKILFLSNPEKADAVLKDSNIPKLFYSEAKKYRCKSINWGDSKGLDDFVDVCIVLNQTSLKLYNSGKIREMAPLTKKKFYVACTRARRNIIFVPESLLNPFLI